MTGPGTRKRALVVEDEAAIRELLRLHLDLAGFVVEEVGRWPAALDGARGGFDLILLDVMLPGLDGISVCRAIRAETANQRTPDPDDHGARRRGRHRARPRERRRRLPDQAVRRPRADGARHRAHAAARSRHVTAPASRGRGHRRPDLDARPSTAARAVRGGRVELTRQEFDLLHLLASRPGIVFSRAALLQQVWRGDTFVTERTVDTVISRLRRKIERDPQDPECCSRRGESATSSPTASATECVLDTGFGAVMPAA